MQTPPPQPATHSLLRCFCISGGIICVLPFPRTLRWSCCSLQTGRWCWRAVESSPLQPAKPALQKELLAEGRLCQPDVQCEGNRSSGNDSKISVEHEGGFQLLWKSRSWHTPLCCSWAGWISCVHRGCSGCCWSPACEQSQNTALQTCQTPTHFFFFPSLFPFPLLHPEIPLAIQMPSLSGKCGWESQAINKGKWSSCRKVPVQFWVGGRLCGSEHFSTLWRR